MRINTSTAAAAVFALVASAALAQEGTATGTFTVNGKPAKLVYAYAIPDEDASRKVVRVYLSDVKLTPKQLDFPFGLQAAMKAGQVHAIVAEIDATKKVVNAMLYDKAFGMDLVSEGGASNTFEGTIDNTSVAGKLYRSAPGETNKIAFDFAVTFKVPIQRKR